MQSPNLNVSHGAEVEYLYPVKMDISGVTEGAPRYLCSKPGGATKWVHATSKATLISARSCHFQKDTYSFWIMFFSQCCTPSPVTLIGIMHVPQKGRVRSSGSKKWSCSEQSFLDWSVHGTVSTIKGKLGSKTRYEMYNYLMLSLTEPAGPPKSLLIVPSPLNHHSL